MAEQLFELGDCVLNSPLPAHQSPENFGALAHSRR